MSIVNELDFKGKILFGVSISLKKGHLYVVARTSSKVKVAASRTFYLLLSYVFQCWRGRRCKGSFKESKVRQVRSIATENLSHAPAAAPRSYCRGLWPADSFQNQALVAAPNTERK